MPATTTTIRIPTASRATLQRLADGQGRPISQVAAEAIDHYDRERALAELNAAYATLREDPVAWADWQAELGSLEGTLADGLKDDPWTE